jgi:hypothetical protein
MECDHGCSMGIFYELCESQLCEGIGEEILGERYMMLANEKWEGKFSW